MSRLLPSRALLLVTLFCVAACAASDAPVAVGTLERDRLDLVAEAPEPVLERPVAEGDYVEAGTLLVKLDPARLEAQLSQAQGVRARAAARLAELVRGPRPERIAEARAHLAGAEGRLATARRDLARTRELFEERVASRDRLDQRRALFDEALAARDAARATLAERVEGTTEEELAQARATLAEAEAAVADARVRLARLEVRAPAAGWLDALPYEPGERPPAGGVVAVLLEDATPYARVYVPEALRVRVRAGTPARVRVDGLPAALDGRVRTVASDASFTPYYALTERDRGRLVYVAKVDLTDPGARELPTGIPVEVEFDAEALPAPPGDVAARR